MKEGINSRAARRLRRALRAAFLATLASLSAPTSAHALSCAVDAVTAVAQCQSGGCTSGFRVDKELVTGTSCRDTRLVSRALSDEEHARFRDLIQHLEETQPNGIYELTGSSLCLSERWREIWCISRSEVARVADAGDTETLEDLRSEWLAREERSHEAARARPFKRASWLIGLTLGALAWSWIFLARKVRRRRRVVLATILAIIVQSLLALKLHVYLNPLIAGYGVEWPVLGASLRALILASILFQVLYVVWFRGRFRLR